MACGVAVPVRDPVGGLVLAGLDGAGDAELDRGVVVGAAVELGELVVGAGEADLEAFDLAEPAFAFGLVDAGKQVFADLFQPCPLRWVWPQERTSDAGLTEMILVSVIEPLSGGSRPVTAKNLASMCRPGVSRGSMAIGA